MCNCYALAIGNCLVAWTDIIGNVGFKYMTKDQTNPVGTFLLINIKVTYQYHNYSRDCVIYLV